MREAEQLLSFALELQASRQMNKSEAEENSNQMRQTNYASQSEQTNIAGKQTKVEKENGMKKDEIFKRTEMNSEEDDSKMEEEDMVNKDFLEVDVHLIEDKKNLAVKIENINWLYFKSKFNF